MYILDEIADYDSPDALSELCNWLHRVSDEMSTYMKKALFFDLQELVDTYSIEPTMNNILKNIQGFMEEELFPYVRHLIGKPFYDNEMSKNDEFLASKHEDWYMEDGESEYDENEYLVYEEMNEILFRKSSPLRFDRLSTITEASVEGSHLEENAGVQSSLITKDENCFDDTLSHSCELFAVELDLSSSGATPRRKPLKDKLINAGRINDEIATFVGLFMNGLLVWLIFNVKVDGMKKYSRILLQACIVDIYLTIATFIVKPIILVEKGVEFFLMNGFFRKTTPFIGQILYQFWTFSLIFSITSVPVATIFRYRVFCLNQPFTLFDQLKYLSVSAASTVIFCIIIFSTYFFASEDDLLMAENLKFLADDDGRVRTTGMMKTNSFVLYAHVIWLTVITFGSYGVIIWCNAKVYKHMKRYTTLQRHYVRDTQKQLNKILTAQAVIPLFTAVLPLSILVIALYIESLSIAVPTSCASIGLSWIPTGNSISVLFFVTPYRRLLFSYIICRPIRDHSKLTIPTRAIFDTCPQKLPVSPISHVTKF